MGLSMEVLLFPWTLDTYMGLLDCKDERRPDEHIGILLRLLPQITFRGNRSSTDHALRMKVNGKSWTSNLDISRLPSVHARIYIEDKDAEKLTLPPKRYGYWIRKFEGRNRWAKDGKLRAISWNEWNESDRLFEIPEGRYATAGILQLHCEVSDLLIRDLPIVLRLGFSPIFEPVIEFGVTYGFSRGKSPSEEESILCMVDWMKEKESKMDQGVIFHGTGRDSTIQETYYWKGGSNVEISCEKLMTEGAETWVLDVIWERSSKSQSSGFYRDKNGREFFRQTIIPAFPPEPETLW